MCVEKIKPNVVSMAVTFDNFQPINNTGFVRGQCKVAYAGKNRNYTDIPRTAFDSAESTIFGVPIVGNWLEDIHNFGGHDLILETKGNKLSIKDNTVPYGFVPQDANPRWEEIYDENGNAKSYFVVDVILWKERYPEPIQFIIDNKVNQSMEIMVKDGEWDDDWEYFVIHDFYYSALCLLGRDISDNGVKGEDNVEPCFEQAEVEVVDFSMNQDFKNTFAELKQAFERGDIVDNPVTYEAEFKALATKFEKLNKQFADLQAEHNQLKQDRDELQAYKDARELEILKSQKQEIINEYALLLDENEMQEVIENQDDYSLDELKFQLATIFADKSLEQAKQKNSKSKKDDDIVVFDNKQPSEKPKKNRFAI
jgi:hypothetical protein